MAYTGKTNWQINDIVMPQDMNRIEQGIINAHENLLTHNTDTGSHTDIRNKIGTDLSSHNTSTSAHMDIRNKIQTVQQNASLFMLPVKRNTTYAVGDCASATGLPSWAYLECITAGTTAETEPSFGGGQSS